MGHTCYLYNSSNPLSWGDCCDELDITPKPIWLVIVLTLPVEYYLAAVDVKATISMYQKQAFWGECFLLIYNVATILAIGLEFDAERCGNTLAQRFECYQGVLFVFYNSSAALAAMTVWTLTLMRKYYWFLYFVTRAGIRGKRFWRYFDKSNETYGGTELVVKRWREIGVETSVYWYNMVAIAVMLIVGCFTHVIPMFFAYLPLFGTLVAAMTYCHCFRLGYSSTSTNWRAATLSVVFYPLAVLLCIPGILLSCTIDSILRMFFQDKEGQVKSSNKIANRKAASVLKLLVVSSEESQFRHVSSGETVRDFMRDVQSTFYTGNRNRGWKLTHLNTVLADLDSTLADYRIENGDMINILYASEDICSWKICSCCCSRCQRKDSTSPMRTENFTLGPNSLTLADFDSGEGASGSSSATYRFPVPAKQGAYKRAALGNYIRDFLRSLCLFDPNGKVIMFAGAIAFLIFTISFNYGVLLYSGASYFEVIQIEWNARRSDKWFSCTFEDFPRSSFTVVDCLGIVVSACFVLVDVGRAMCFPLKSGTSHPNAKRRSTGTQIISPCNHIP